MLRAHRSEGRGLSRGSRRKTVPSGKRLFESKPARRVQRCPGSVIEAVAAEGDDEPETGPETCAACWFHCLRRNEPEKRTRGKTSLQRTESWGGCWRAASAARLHGKSSHTRCMCDNVCVCADTKTCLPCLVSCRLHVPLPPLCHLHRCERGPLLSALQPLQASDTSWDPSLNSPKSHDPCRPVLASPPWLEGRDVTSQSVRPRGSRQLLG